MIVSPGKFKAIIFDELTGSLTNRIINIDHKEINALL